MGSALTLDKIQQTVEHTRYVLIYVGVVDAENAKAKLPQVGFSRRIGDFLWTRAVRAAINLNDNIPLTA